jgi:uncharacterized protein (DUF2384 family)
MAIAKLVEEAHPAASAASGRAGATPASRSMTVAEKAAAKPVARKFDGTHIYRIDPRDRIELIRKGIPAATIGVLSTRMGMSKELLLASLGLKRSTISKKEKEAAVLSKDESERVLGVGALIGMVETMVEQSGDPTGFDAARWVAEWLEKPLPALAGETPASYMDTFEGQKIVAELLSYSQSGAYA